MAFLVATSARTGEVEDARAYGCDVVSAYEMHEIGMVEVLAKIPEGPYYLTIDADGVDPSIMPRRTRTNSGRAKLASATQVDSWLGRSRSGSGDGFGRNRAKL